MMVKTTIVLSYFVCLLLINSVRLTGDVQKNSRIARKIATKMLRASNAKVQAFGVENIPQEGGTMIVVNHKSLWDVFVVAATVNRPMGFVAAKELYVFPLTQYLDAIRCVCLDRFIDAAVNKKMVVETQRKVVDALQSGYCLTIYPEGGLVYGDDLGDFKTASFSAPQKTDAHVVPAYISGTVGINKKGRWLVIPKTRITIVFGKAIRPSAAGAKNSAELCAVVREKIEALKEEITKDHRQEANGAATGQEDAGIGGNA